MSSAPGAIGEKHGVSEAAAAVARILRHPASMQPIAGAVDSAHPKESARRQPFT